MIDKHTKLLVLILTIFGYVAIADEPEMVSADAPKLPFATPLQWKSTDILIKPISDESHTIVSVKDPTVVYWNGLWHIYATAYSTSARTWSMARPGPWTRTTISRFTTGTPKITPSIGSTGSATRN